MNLFILTAEEAEKLGESFYRSVCPLRYERSKRFLKKDDRLCSLGAGALIYYCSGYPESAVAFGKYGKPYFTDNKAYFNISHSYGITVMAVNDGVVGVDIEYIDDKNAILTKSVFTEAEIADIDKDLTVRFHLYWTLKESVMKADGRGMMLDPSSFSVISATDGGTVEVEGKRWYCKWKMIDNYIVSVCASRPIDEIKVINCSAAEIGNKNTDCEV